MTAAARKRTLCGAALLWLVAVDAAAANDLERGRQLYASRCAFCHGTTGTGDGPAGAALKPPPTNLTSAEFWKSAGAQRIRASVENGKPGTAMMGFKSLLRAEEIDDLVAYLNTLQPAR